MRLEALPKFFSPKSLHISDAPRATASDSLSITDVMTSLGLAGLKAKMGIELFLAKQGISSPDSAVESLTQYALKETSQYKAISKLDKNIKQSVVQTLARYAFADYARSAASVRECECCKGEGFIEADVFTMKSHYTMGLPEWAKALGQSPSDFEVKRKVPEVVRLLCKACGGKKVVSNACRCHGKGKVLDQEQTEIQGVPVMKNCDKCSARGYARLPAETVRLFICENITEITQPTWSRNFKPFYEMLITKCHQEEDLADSELQKVTKGENIAA
ncbi:antitermination protein [Yersinia mollaretii]|uniref:antitermination protein n=1 Tax=Yersinia mollaretii TaxID=33060 RepID=UPI000C15A048|nr:antitermination protein [Yersinia mollaretii]MDA5529096.1 antitermination protein [Yersinia mollaretii]MDR7875790.1 antitermination protein [Yersinia mollaretii]PHZ29630.1 antitermination protein [Yersinia mollaretii]WQC73776.1 antitermination protein [Yersinia mollaretii]WQC74036.1 antitermination protein [Yersinia mollaretii]